MIEATIPDWLPTDAWEGYLSMRKTIKRPASVYAQKLAIGKLLDLMEQGHDIRAVLEQSIFNCWQGLFPLPAPPVAKPVLQASGRPQLKAVDNWYMSEAGITRKGIELGMNARRGETFSAYKGRIFDRLNEINTDGRKIG